MIIYVDEFFLKNFVMDLIILCLCGEVLEIKYKMREIVITSFLITLISFLIVINHMEEWMFLKVLLTILMIKLAYPNIKTTLITTSGVMIITFLLGGILQANIQNKIEKIMIVTFSILAITHYLNSFKKKKWKARNAYYIEFKIEQQKVLLKAFLDTGNFMTYGIKEEPVVFVSNNSIKKQISGNALNKINELGKRSNHLKDACLVPYSFADGSSKESWGLRIKNASIFNQQIFLVKDIVILVSNQKYQEYDALLGIRALEGGLEDGNNFDVSSKSSTVFC